MISKKASMYLTSIYTLLNFSQRNEYIVPTEKINARQINNKRKQYRCRVGKKFKSQKERSNRRKASKRARA